MRGRPPPPRHGLIADAGPTSARSDDDLPGPILEAFACGSVEALGEVYRRYNRPVLTVVSKTLNGSGVVDDAVQEVFLRAWRSAGRYDPARPLGPWLFTIARRTAIDVLRREMRPTRGDHDPYDNLPSTGLDEVELWQAWEVREAIGRLPDEEAEVVRLAHLHGLTHREIAERLGLPIGTVKSRSHRAHRRLAALLSHLAIDADE